MITLDDPSLLRSAATAARCLSAFVVWGGQQARPSIVSQSLGHGDPASPKRDDAASAGSGAAPARSGVAVNRLVLTDVRCFPSLRLEEHLLAHGPTGPAGGPAAVAVTGANGVGKTTVLEALSLLAPGRGIKRARLEDIGHRRAVDVDVEPASAPTQAHTPTPTPWAIAARVRVAGSPLAIGTGVAARDGGGGDRRVVRIDGRTARSTTALAEHLGLVWLTPEMDRLFQESAATRRRFLDRLVYGVDPRHAERIGAFERAMRERSRLLRRGTADRAWLSALEDTMAKAAVAAVAARMTVAEALAGLSGAAMEPFPGADLEVAGDVERSLADVPALDVEDRLRGAYATARGRDAETGGATIGPHRSDLVVRHRRSGRPAGVCSTGEQKALVIALVLAGARLQTRDRGVAPLLLLDDVAAHLDARHQRDLFLLVSALGSQAWYTGTDREVFRPLSGQALGLGLEAGGKVIPFEL